MVCGAPVTFNRGATLLQVSIILLSILYASIISFRPKASAGVPPRNNWKVFISFWMSVMFTRIKVLVFGSIMVVRISASSFSPKPLELCRMVG